MDAGFVCSMETGCPPVSEASREGAANHNRGRPQILGLFRVLLNKESMELATLVLLGTRELLEIPKTEDNGLERFRF